MGESDQKKNTSYLEKLLSAALSLSPVSNVKPTSQSYKKKKIVAFGGRRVSPQCVAAMKVRKENAGICHVSRGGSEDAK